MMFLKIGVPKMLATETAIFRKSCFERTPLTFHLSLYYLSLLNQNLQCLRILQIILLILLKTPNQGRISNAFLTRIFCGICNIWFYQVKKLFYTAPGYLTAVWCVRNKIKFIYFDLLPLLFFASFMKNHHHTTLFSIIDTDHFTLNENNFSLSQFLQIKE